MAYPLSPLSSLFGGKVEAMVAMGMFPKADFLQHLALPYPPAVARQATFPTEKINNKLVGLLGGTN